MLCSLKANSGAVLLGQGPVGIGSAQRPAGQSPVSEGLSKGPAGEQLEPLSPAGLS